MTASIKIEIHASSYEAFVTIMDRVKEEVFHCIQDGEGQHFGDHYHYTTDGDLEDKLGEEEEETTEKKAALIWHDRDKHGEGCACGDCDTNGVSIGYAIYDVTGLPEHLFTEEYETELDDKLYHELDPEDVCYGPDSQVAYERARDYAEEQGYQIVVGSFTLKGDKER